MNPEKPMHSSARSIKHSSFVIERRFDFDPAQVYRAWVDPAAKARWFNGPADKWTEAVREMDVRVGGKYRWDLTSPEGEEMSAFGEYKELVPGKKIVFTWQWDDDEAWENRTSVVTIELFERRGERNCG